MATGMGWGWVGTFCISTRERLGQISEKNLKRVTDEVPTFLGRSL